MRRLWVGASVSVAVLAVAGTAVAVHPGLLPWHRDPLVAAAYLPSWDDAGAASLRTATAHGVSEVSPVWATVNADGSLATVRPPAAETAALRASGVRVVPTVQNIRSDSWEGSMVATLLSDSRTAARHVDVLVAAALDGDWQGVDIDYEQLPPTAGTAFTTFLAALGDRLHQHGLVLSVDVPARTADDSDETTLAYPYQLIGSIVDEVRVMAYDHAYDTSDPGPVAPLPWVREVVRYAVARVPASKIMLGIAAYGYDWDEARGTSLTAAGAAGLAGRRGVVPTWHADSAAASYTYVQDGQAHTVWYEDARSLAAKQQAASDAGLRGIAIWRLGGEDPDSWTHVAAATEGSRR